MKVDWGIIVVVNLRSFCERNIPKIKLPLKVSIRILRSDTTMNCSQVETPVKTTSMQNSFPETVSKSLCRKPLLVQTSYCISCPGGWSSDNHAGGETGCGGLGPRWLHVVYGCKVGWMHCQIFWNDIGDGLWQWKAHSSHWQRPACHCTLPQGLRHLQICVGTNSQRPSQGSSSACSSSSLGVLTWT